MELHNFKPPQVGDQVVFKYGEHGWLPATITKVHNTEYYAHLKDNSDPELCDRAVSTYVDLDVPLTKEQHHQGLEDVVMKASHVGYSHNPDHDHMWCHPDELKVSNNNEVVITE